MLKFLTKDDFLRIVPRQCIQWWMDRMIRQTFDGIEVEELFDGHEFSSDALNQTLHTHSSTTRPTLITSCAAMPPIIASIGHKLPVQVFENSWIQYWFNSFITGSLSTFWLSSKVNSKKFSASTYAEEYWEVEQRIEGTLTSSQGFGIVWYFCSNRERAWKAKCRCGGMSNLLKS